MLARQFLAGFLAVTLPGAAVLAAVTLYALSSLDRVSRHLAEITLSLEATRELQLAVNRAESRLGRSAGAETSRRRAEFDDLMLVAEQRMGSCASAPCHGASRTPSEMAKILRPAVERLKRYGRAILESAREETGARETAVVDEMVAGIDRELDGMSSALRRRVENLGTQAESVARRASMLVVALTVAIALAASGAAVALARHIAASLRDLLAGIRHVMAGEWSYGVRVGKPGEMAEVASSFNTMMGELRHYRERLEESNRTLEHRVSERSQELRRVERALERSEELASLGRLAAAVAHRLNNPLTSILMKASLLVEEPRHDAQLTDDLRTIASDVRRCAHVLDELRLFATPGEPNRVASDVNAVAERALSSTGQELAARGIQVERDLGPDPLAINWDADQMLQVLVSLVLNAAQAMPHGGRLRVRARSQEGGLALEVRDTGGGIPVEHRGKVFDPFFTTKTDGTGLGLSISHRIVEAHGGRIEIESRTREESREPGTSVRIMLPHRACPARASQPPDGTCRSERR